MNVNPGDMLAKLVYWVVMAVNAFLGLRFVLRLFNANTSSDFVAWLYSNTHPLLKPFTGIFESLRLEGGYTVEFSTLFAIIIYSLGGFLIMALVDALSGSTTHKTRK